MTMTKNSYNYNLPPELIAQTPTTKRDHSRLMIIDKNKKTIDAKHHFFDLPKFLGKNDVLVFNNSKVFPARLKGKKESGGKAEVFLLNKIKNNIWECLVGANKQKENLEIILPAKLCATLVKQISKSNWQVQFNKDPLKVANKHGQVPTPPYIKKISNQDKLRQQYQTVYAAKTGSAAAPTAGLHFTKPLIAQLKKQGVKIEYVTLHVGLGTFLPLTETNLKTKKLHSEQVEISSTTAKKLNKYKKQGKKIIAIGTTTTRTLEAMVDSKGTLMAGKKSVDIFIYPPYKFKFVDNLITNFHLPESSLLMLVSALASKQLIDKAYRTAVKQRYRFFSFGDVMLIK